MQSHSQTQRRTRPRRLWWTAAILPITVLAGWATPGDEPASLSQESVEPRPRVETVTVTLEDAYRVERFFVGRVEAARSSDLGFELGGRIAEVLVEEGQTVRAGQPLAVLDTARLLARRSELVAALGQARAQSELAQATHDRVSEASRLDAVSQQEHDEARLGLQAREAAVQQLEAQIGSVDVEVGKSILEAPYAAVVAAQLVDEGVVLPAGQPVMRLLEADRLEARIGVPPSQIAGLAPGDELDVSVRGYPIPARVETILPDREDRTRTVTVLLTLSRTLADDGARIRDGDLAEITLTRRVEQPGFWLPASALTEGVRGLWAAFVAEPTADGHRIRRRDVEVLHTETDRVFARGALRDAEQVVASGVHRWVPGQEVTVVSRGDAS